MTTRSLLPLLLLLISLIIVSVSAWQLPPRPQHLSIAQHQHKQHPQEQYAVVEPKNEVVAALTSAAIVVASQAVFPLAALAATSGGEASETLLVLSIVRPVFDTFVNTMSFLFICRTVISWYPKTDLTTFPYSVVAWPTEPLLVPVRELVPPAFGVDVSAIVWIMLLSFLREILTGQQGILTLLEKS